MTHHLSKFSEQIISEFSEKAIEHRKHFHKFPELSGNEKLTSKYIADTLKKIGIQQITEYSDYGIAAYIPGSDQSQQIVGIRAEMDALPITETNDIAHKSLNEGIMHACGHDVHMGILLAFAELLFQNRTLLPVGVKLIFQPSEETLPGGASQLIKQGVFNHPNVDFMLGFHVLPEMKAGMVGFRQGIYMASSDEIYLTLHGKGGHAAMPHLLNDPVICASQILTSLQQLISRRASPEIPTVLSFGKFVANGRTNVIPDMVEIEGTFRTFNEAWREKAHSIISDITINTAKAANIHAELQIIRGYPVLFNNETLTQQMHKAVETMLGKENVVSLPLRMTSDDFAYYSQNIPSCYFRIGAGDPESEQIRYLHTSGFDVHNNIFTTGLNALTACLFDGY